MSFKSAVRIAMVGAGLLTVEKVEAQKFNGFQNQDNNPQVILAKGNSSRTNVSNRNTMKTFGSHHQPLGVPTLRYLFQLHQFFYWNVFSSTTF